MRSRQNNAVEAQRSREVLEAQISQVLMRKDSRGSDEQKTEQNVKEYADQSFDSKLVSSSNQKSRNDAMANELSRSFDNRQKSH